MADNQPDGFAEAQARNTRCRRCGGLLEMRGDPDRIVCPPQDIRDLIESSLRRGTDEVASDQARVPEKLQEQMRRWRRDNVHPLRRLLLRVRRMLKGPSPAGHFGYVAFKGDMFCRTCGEKSVGGRAVTYSHEDTGNVLKRLLDWLKKRRLFVIALRGNSSYKSVTGLIDLSRLVAHAAFPVYGLKGSPLGLRLEGIGWSSKGNGRPVDRVTLTYVATGPKGAQQAIELSQHADTTGVSNESRLSSELLAILSLVTSHGSEELRREYLRRGNIHRDWNLARISHTERRRLTVEVDGAPADVELAFWWEPEPVVVAHIMRDGDSILATSIGITHVRLLSLLKTMVVLQRDPETLAGHQQEYEQTYRYRTSLRCSTPSWNKAKRIEVQLGSVGPIGDSLRQYQDSIGNMRMKYIRQSWIQKLRRALGTNRGGMPRMYTLSTRGGIPIRQTKLAPDGLEFSEDVSEARWVEESFSAFGTLRSLLPDGFAAYARIFHPAYLNRDEERPVRWSTVASWTGRTVHPLMQFERIAGLSEDPHDMYKDPPWGSLPKHRSIPERECRTLVEVLRSFTSTPGNCFFCLWEGYGNIDTRLYKASSRVRAPGRDYLLFRGPIDAIMAFITRDGPFWGHSPNIWWPENRAWCVATDIDLFDTYVGGSEDCIEAVLSNPDLEALPTTLDARLDLGGDTINARDL